MTTAMRSVRLVFAGGGTGGHLYPAIAIADRVREIAQGRMNVEIVFVGTKRGLEYRLGNALGYRLQLTTVWGLARRLSLRNLLVPFILIWSLIRASRFLAQFAPQLVVATGGYVCWPVARMAARSRIPVLLQEQNSYPGITTRRLAPLASRIYLGFGKAAEHLHSDGQIRVTGNPVRRTITHGNREEALRTFRLSGHKRTILILGGSQGARAVNQAASRALRDAPWSNDFQLLWQTGKGDYTDVIATAGERAQGHSLFPFENRMELVYAAADIAVARAGAITLAEFEACALPSVLIPYPFAAADHQRKNAQEFERQGFAVVIDESRLASTDPIGVARELLATGKADQMREAIRSATAGRKPAVDVIAEEIVDMLSQGETTGGKVEH